MDHMTRFRFMLLATCFVVIDQITKLVFSSRDFFIGTVHFHLVKNFGLAFSLDFGLVPNIFLIGAALIFFGYYYLAHRQKMSGITKLMFLLIFAGAISNLVDRIYLGYVRDFVDLGLGFTFNLADAFLALGLLGFLGFYSGKTRVFPEDL
jgi:signal peptidase II